MSTPAQLAGRMHRDVSRPAVASRFWVSAVWMLPVRHALGALLMSDGRYSAAEAVYREDLERNRDNGWALTGLKLALQAQQRGLEAEELAPRLAQAFNTADTRPTSSCYCEP